MQLSLVPSTWDAELEELASLARAQSRSAPPVSQALYEVGLLHELGLVRYGYDPREAHVTWAAAVRRGYAACGEAAAYLAAAGLREGRRVELVMYRSDYCGPHYSHVVAVVDGHELDVYAGYACPARGRVVAALEVLP